MASFGLDWDLLRRSLNYHGQQLTSLVRENFTGEGPDPVSEVIKGGTLDYNLYHRRSRELRIEDRGKRLLLHSFIAQNVTGLFSSWPQNKAQIAASLADEEKVTAILPPMETFLPLADTESRTLHFFELVKPGDALYCAIGAQNRSGLLLKVLCFAGPSTKSRRLDDLRLRCLCPADQFSSDFNAGSTENVGVFVCVTVLDVKRDAQRMLASMKEENLSPENKDIKLGVVKEPDLHPSYKMTRQALERHRSYSDCLEESVGLGNPGCVARLTAELGLSNQGGCSLMPSLSGFPEAECAESLRRRQNAKWALAHVSSGVRYFKAGNNSEAFQCLNQALRIDPENVEGLVARGALCANSGSLEKAVVDFEAALAVDAHHKNARNYLCETLVAIARKLEQAGKDADALDTFTKVLRVDPEHREAAESVKYLSRKNDSKAELEEKIELLIGGNHSGEKKRSKRHRRKKRSRSFSSCSSASSSSRSSRNRRRSRSKRKSSKRRRRSRSRSSSSSSSPVSPLPVTNKGRDLDVSSSLPPNPSTMSTMNMTATTSGAAAVPPQQLSIVPPQFNVPPPGYYVQYPNYGGSYGAVATVAAVTTTSTSTAPRAPSQSKDDEEYERKVREFLKKTGSVKTSPKYDQREHDACQEFDAWRQHKETWLMSEAGKKRHEEKDVRREGSRTSGSKSIERGSSRDDRATEREKSSSRSRKDSLKSRSGDRSPAKEKKRRRSRSDSRERKEKKRRRSRSRSKQRPSYSRDKRRDHSDEENGFKSKKGKKHPKDDSDSSDREERSVRRRNEEKLRKKSVQELVKMKASDIDVESFAQEINNFLNKSELNAAKRSETPKQHTDKTVYVDGLDIVVKDLRNDGGRPSDRVREVKARLDRSPPSKSLLTRSPGVAAVFSRNMDEDEDEGEKQAVKRGIGNKGPDMWKPTGLESMQARRDAAVKRVQRMEEEADDEERRSKRANKRWEGRDGQMRTQFEIKLDPVSGMYTRVAKNKPLSQEDNGDEEERRIVTRRRSGSPPRPLSKEDKKHSRSRSPERRRSGETRRRSRSRERRRLRGRRRSRSREWRSRSRNRDDEDWRRVATRGGEGRVDRSEEWSGIMSESLKLEREREAIEKEREAIEEELLRQQREFVLSSLPSPVPATKHLAASASQYPSRKTSPTIIPGARSLEEIEEFMSQQKRKKRDEMIERNKGFVKPRAW